ncbi:MAG: prepilin-type N-terminal cleavage/methylation domain-containing protein [Actinomycetota bacterium]|nr:prepilin-type N-terminal cleavage/methylation domain-containing protein [Actinomycetota bacterium]
MLRSAVNRVRSRMQSDEAGFTLIELLVVVIIIGILAAIAIPTFLNQRKKGWESAVKSDLRNYAIVMETHLTDTGSYASPPAVTGTSADVVVTVPVANTTTYCIQGYHAKNSGEIWSLRPGGGATALTKSACTTT